MSADFLRLTALIVIVSVMAVLIKARLPEYSFLLVLAAICVSLLFVFTYIFPHIEKLRGLFEKSGNTSLYFGIALKALGIAYITDFAVNTCRDFGLNALAQIADIAGKGAVFILSIPLICAVLETALKFVGL